MESRLNSLLTNVAGKIDSGIATITRDEPEVHPGLEGQKIVVFHRFGVPESGRWVILPEGKPTVLKSTDIVHTYDQNNELLERTRVKNSPTSFEVFPEGMPLPDKVLK